MATLALCWICWDSCLPPIELANLLPDPNDIITLIIFNRAYEHHLDAIQEVWGSSDALDTVRAENRQLYEFWDHCRDARTSIYSDRHRRLMLNAIVQAIGYERIVQGDWPAFVPYWRFQVDNGIPIR